MRNLLTRIERLEAQQPIARGRTHRMIQEEGEQYASARARYERDCGTEIGPDDFVIVRVIVAPTQEIAA